jgi:uncharacterized protein (TIGR02271 family)
MTHTVIGFFKNSADAFNAADVLRERGFGIENVDVMTNSKVRERDDTDERSGKIGSFFKSLFTDNEDEAERYSRLTDNNSMITVHASNSDEAERAAEILDEYGAIDIDDGGVYSGNERRSAESDMESADFREMDNTDLDDADFDADRPGRQYHREINVSDESGHDLMDVSDDSDYDFDVTSDIDQDRAHAAHNRDFENADEASIPVVEENVNVGKREVRRGGVRVRSRIISRPVEETLRLREERVRVERTPVDRDATDADLDNFSEETVEVHAYGEEPVVSKRSRVVEEVKVGKDVHERSETVRERARKTEIDVENLDDDNSTESTDRV